MNGENNPHLRRLDQIQAAQKQFNESEWRLSFLRTTVRRTTTRTRQRSDMQNIYADHLTSTTLELNLPKPDWAGQISKQPRTPAIWFAEKFPDQVNQFGCPFLEMRQSNCDGFSRVNPVAPNIDFFAAMLGGDSRLGHSVVYFEPELQFYYREPVLNIYKPTTPEKLQNYYRAMILRCAQELNNEVDKLNMFLEFRSDKIAKAVVNRAKSILAADSSFFSATSKHQRIKGPELFERLIRVLCETMLERKEDSCLTVTQAYQAFCKLSEQRQLGQLKRSHFKEIMRDLVHEEFGLGLRRDVPDSENKQQEAWKGLKLLDAGIMTT